MWSDAVSILEDPVFDDAARQHWHGQTILHVMEMVCDYARRIRSPCRRFPLLLFWLIKSPCDAICNDRAACARDLLRCSDDTISDAGTCKFRDIFRNELQAASVTGLLDERLFTLVTDIECMWPSDTQVIEGCNSILRRIVTLSPRISWKLASSRLQNQKILSALTAKESTQHGRQTAIRALVEQCAFHHDATRTLVDEQDSQRFSPPDPAQYPISAPRPRETHTEAELVAASKVVRFKQGLLAMGKKFEPSAEFVFKLGDASERWFIGLCCKSYARVVQAEEVVRGGDGPCGVRFKFPRVIRPLFELFAERDSSGQVVGRADASDEWTIGGHLLQLKWDLQDPCGPCAVAAEPEPFAWPRRRP